MGRKPNFLFIMTDQHRADHLGCYGNTVVRTPNLDGIAAGGTRFERFYVATPICMPNRAAIMTGRISSLNGLACNGLPLSHDHATFVELLRDAGYATALVGKSHFQPFTGRPAVTSFMPDLDRHTPSSGLISARKLDRVGNDYDFENARKWERPLMERHGGNYYGFDHYEVVAGHGDRASGDYLLWAREREPEFDRLTGPRNALPDNRYSAPQAWRTAVPEELYSTSWIEERATDWLTTHATEEKPFFLQMSFPDPHHPFTPPGKYWDMYAPDDIDLPASFGKGELPPLAIMREALRDGTAKREGHDPYAVSVEEARASIALTYGMITMIDDAVGRVLIRLKELRLDENTVVIFTSDHGDFMGDHGLMLKLFLHYQGVIRVPFLWRDPTRDGGVADAGLSSSIDIGATILARAGVQPYHGIQGRDLFGTAPPEGVIVEEDSLRTAQGFDRLQRIRTLVTDRWRMTLHQGRTWGELYDLETDPDELTNLFDNPAYAGTRADLSEIMLRRIIEMQDTSPLPRFRA